MLKLEFVRTKNKYNKQKRMEEKVLTIDVKIQTKEAKVTSLEKLEFLSNDAKKFEKCK